MTEAMETRGAVPGEGAGPSGKEVALILETELDAPLAAVWRALTDPQLVARWLGPAGDASGREAGTDTAIDRRIVESDPPRRLVWAWPIAAQEGDIETRVTFDLSQRADGRVHLRLVHSGFRVAEDRPVDRIAEAEVVVLLPPIRARRLPKRRPRIVFARHHQPLVMRLAA